MNQMLWELSFNEQALKGHQVLIVNFTTFIFKTGLLELANVLGRKKNIFIYLIYTKLRCERNSVLREMQLFDVKFKMSGDMETAFILF